MSQPTWLLRRWVARYGEAEAAKLADSLNRRPPMVVRSNPLRASAADLVAALADRGARVEPCRYVPDGFRVHGGGDPRAWKPLRAGWCAVQDEGAILVGHAVGPQSGETVADVCAAPGTKTTHLAQLMANRGRILATDRHPGRLERARAACQAMGASIVETVPGGVEALARSAGPVCDRVLVDAPCSNLGVLRRNPDAKWRRQPADLAALATVQRAILEAAAQLVRSGGVLVYATCSLEPEENENVVAEFRRHWPAFVPDPIPAPVPRECLIAPERLQAFPHRHDTDGFTVTRLRRQG
jgi:16S rRNA (cytosine967-C5)-methyltransferase